MTTVEYTHSSKLESNVFTYARYDANLHTLYLTFTNGQTVSYTEISLDTYIELVRSGSAGSYYNQYLKSKYPSQRQDQCEWQVVQMNRKTDLSPGTEYEVEVLLTTRKTFKVHATNFHNAIAKFEELDEVRAVYDYVIESVKRNNVN